MGDIADMMIEAEMAGMDYESYCVELAELELARVEKAKKKKKKKVAVPNVGAARGAKPC